MRKWLTNTLWWDCPQRRRRGTRPLLAFIRRVKYYNSRSTSSRRFEFEMSVRRFATQIDAFRRKEVLERNIALRASGLP
jgi:hypothetical protein